MSGHNGRRSYSGVEAGGPNPSGPGEENGWASVLDNLPSHRFHPPNSDCLTYPAGCQWFPNAWFRKATSRCYCSTSLQRSIALQYQNSEASFQRAFIALVTGQMGARWVLAHVGTKGELCRRTRAGTVDGAMVRPHNRDQPRGLS